mmetsp:Transcript_17604/g.48307  ORF Transcript_17604/g.48307 Transcript_17604/m.48307 type:complete len:355 (-) Transcript_17604:372-1436(-)
MPFQSFHGALELGSPPMGNKDFTWLWPLCHKFHVSATWNLRHGLDEMDVYVVKVHLRLERSVPRIVPSDTGNCTLRGSCLLTELLCSHSAAYSLREGSQLAQRYPTLSCILNQRRGDLLAQLNDITRSIPRRQKRPLRRLSNDRTHGSFLDRLVQINELGLMALNHLLLIARPSVRIKPLLPILQNGNPRQLASTCDVVPDLPLVNIVCRLRGADVHILERSKGRPGGHEGRAHATQRRPELKGLRQLVCLMHLEHTPKPAQHLRGLVHHDNGHPRIAQRLEEGALLQGGAQLHFPLVVGEDADPVGLVRTHLVLPRVVSDGGHEITETLAPIMAAEISPGLLAAVANELHPAA